MNIQELIEKYECMNRNLEMWVVTSRVLQDLRQLDEPQKVEIPQLIADWIEKVGGSLFGLNYDSVPSEIYDWVYEEKGNLKKLYLACAIGYTVEKEKRYRVKLKSNTEEVDYLVDTKRNGLRFYSNIYTQSREHTRKEIEAAGFGWVFNCPGIEIEEVGE